MKITHNNIIALILDDESRSVLFREIASQDGNELKTINAISDAIDNLKAIDKSEMIRIKNILLDEGSEGEYILDNFVSHKDFPETLLYELLNENKCISALSHRKQPINFLIDLIAKHDGCLEAIITVGRYYYLSESISVSKFVKHINRYQYSSWLLSSLINILDKDNPKTQPFLDLIATIESGSELIQQYFDLVMERELINTTDISLIIEKAAEKNHRFLKAISQNSCTPLDILIELSTIQDIKYAKKIRINSQETLKNKVESNTQ